MLDNVLVAPDGDCDKRAALYTDGRDAKDPLLSPVYGDMHGFPPAILTTGTRDLLLSSTVRVHRKLPPSRSRGDPRSVPIRPERSRRLAPRRTGDTSELNLLPLSASG
jgi:acetyl esterase/lipase